MAGATKPPPIPPKYFLNGISEGDYQSWKHHPVTKIVMRFLRDREQQVAEHMIAKIRTAPAPLPDYDQGVFQGHINTLRELFELEFEHMDQFYAAEVAEEE